MQIINRLAISAVLIALSFPLLSQVNNPAYADYFLVGRFGEICTMCEAIVLCEAEDHETSYAHLPEGRSYTLYHLQTRTFWSQMATIWEWFIANFDTDSLASTGHSRPVKIYTVTDGNWSKAKIVHAHLSLDPARISLDDHVIDRVTRHWLQDSASSQPIGFCQRMPLWESLDTITRQNPGQDTS
ncbi:MAG: hypothetical protein QGH93_07120 [Gammaproteobacteria bacterium]|jgi:hypothetical protein|nr:hypothetical protein [Gammaproteobacteria bacterium]